MTCVSGPVRVEQTHMLSQVEASKYSVVGDVIGILGLGFDGVQNQASNLFTIFGDFVGGTRKTCTLFSCFGSDLGNGK